MREALVQWINSSKMLRGIAKLASATLISQIIAFLALPILTRLYSTEDFGVYSLYLHVVSIFLLGATFHYDVAVQAPEADDDGVTLSIATLFIVALVALLLTLFLATAGDDLLVFFELSPLLNYMYIFPVGVLGFGVFNVLSNYALRKREYGLVAKTNVTQSIAQVTAQLALSLASLKAWGLLAGDVANRSAGLLSLYLRVFREDVKKTSFSWHRAKSLLWEYRSYPMFGMPSGMLITMGLSLPPILIGRQWGLENLGLFMLATKILDIPKALIGRSISRVYLAESMKLYNESRRELHKLFLKTSAATVGFAVISVIPLAIGFYYLGGPVFGEKWQSAGWIGAYLIPMTFAALVVSPVSQIATVARKLHVELFVSIFRVLFVVSLFWWIEKSEESFERGIWFYSVGSAMVYVFYYIVYFWISAKSASDREGLPSEKNRGRE